VRVLLPLLEEEGKLEAETKAIEGEMTALKETQRQLELRKEEKANKKRGIIEQKEEIFKDIFKNMTAADIFDLGIEFGDLKRRKSSQDRGLEGNQF
jgi:wobble nucleotide-excising tRNase